MSNIDEKLNRTYEFLVEYQQENGYPPTVREICSAMGFKSTATAFVYLNKLEAMGKLKKSPSVNRALTINVPQAKTVNVPLVGKIAAGTPITAAENIEDEIPLPASMFRSGELFMLTVQGDSMINAGIRSGDKLVFRRQQTANNGEIVAAMIDGEATVKRFYREAKHIKLVPENDHLQPIITTDVEVLGVAAGLLRLYNK